MKFKKKILKEIEKNEIIFKDVSNRLKNNKNFVNEAVSINGNVLAFVNNKFKDDKDIVLAAIKQNCSSIKYASDRLKDDIDIANTIIDIDANSIQFLSDNIKNNKNICLRAFELADSFDIIDNFSDSLKTNDKDIVLEFLYSDYSHP